MFSKEVNVPKDVTLEIAGNIIMARGSKGEVKKKLDLQKNIRIEKLDGKVKVSSDSDRRSSKAIVGTIAAHIRNAVEGVTKGYTYRLRIIYSHFPVTVKVEGDKVLVNNFLGERVPRVAKILGSSQVKVDQQDIIVTGPNLDEVSQTAANIEQTCRIIGFDKKVFQDGIYITSKDE
jgi:large subunit ribosomal protein L6